MSSTTSISDFTNYSVPAAYVQVLTATEFVQSIHDMRRLATQLCAGFTEKPKPLRYSASDEKTL